MGLLSWLFGSPRQSNRPNRSLRIIGDGSFDYDVVGESFYQDHLDKVCGGKTENGHQHRCSALLLCEDNNPHDDNAIAVLISGRKVGHLSRSEAAAFRQLLRSHGIKNARVRCDALVVGGWKRGTRSEGHYGVKLDISAGATLTDL